MQRRADLAAIALIAVAVIRIASTFTLYSAMVDEPMHVSAGLQLYTQHDYSYQPENPPLPRIVFALAPWLGGMDFDPNATMEQQLGRVFYSDHRYERNLVLARSGNLLFFIVAAMATWWWARRELGAAGGFIATALFTLQPIVVGYSGIVTHDAAATAGVAVSLLAFAQWLDEPSMRRATLFGAAFGFAVLCKFSCIGYVPAACLAMFAFKPRNLARSAFAALLACAITICAGYAFAMHSFVDGIRGLIRLDQSNFFAYAFGQIKPRGWWWYFPVAISMKSTIASLILGFCALFTKHARAAFTAALAILAVSMTSHLDLGVRYVLPFYAPLSVAGAGAAIAMFHHQRLRIAAAVLLAWHAVASIVAVPDAFPYFNELVARRPWLYLLDSNLDWGQDLLRLRSVVRAKRIDRIGIAAVGWHDYDALGFPPNYPLLRTTPTQGWVAVSEQSYAFFRYDWLRGRRYERVGKSIRLYYIP